MSVPPQIVGALALGNDLLSGLRAGSSSPPTIPSAFGWGEVFGDAVVAAMIDRLVHHAEFVFRNGDSCRLKDRDLGIVPTDDAA